MLTFHKPTNEDIEHVAANMRRADVVEVMALGHTPIDALRSSVKMSTFVSVARNPEPFAIFGLYAPSLLGDLAHPWLLATDELLRNKKALTIHTRAILDQMKTMYPVLENAIHVDNVVSIAWLKRIGFKMYEPQPTGVNGELFMRFSNV